MKPLPNDPTGGVFSLIYHLARWVMWVAIVAAILIMVPWAMHGYQVYLNWVDRIFR